MIIAETEIDKNGYFQFQLDYLPEEQKLYRLHITKQSDSKSSLIIGGKNENFLLLIAHKNADIHLSTNSVHPPFKKVYFKAGSMNSKFQTVTDLINTRDSIASVSDVYKRKFINDRLESDLLNIADTSSNPLISMYAIYKSNFETDYRNNKNFYESYSEKWSEVNNSYFINFREKIPAKQPDTNILLQVLLYILLVLIGFAVGKYLPFKTRGVDKLSVQERKILEELRKGASNKEISEKFNIGLSTVKSHVSSILSKMNVKSRKELMQSD
jgi:DNA-binding CsgD family transcriptional regulator